MGWPSIYDLSLASVVLVGEQCMTDQDLAVQRVIKPLNKLNNCRLAAPRGTNQGDVRARLNGQVEVAKDANARTSRVPEVNVPELDPAFGPGKRLAL